jgi:hypothetical protein
MPISKTLLRRHLATHFSALLGNELVQQKRQSLQDAGNLMALRECLSPSMKIKVRFLAISFFFSLLNIFTAHPKRIFTTA